MKPKIINAYFTDDELLRISNKIKSVEKTTSGEIAVSIREYKSLFEMKASLRQLAEKEYFRLGINKTKGGTGILIFLLLSKRQFYILADDNINKFTGNNVWAEIKNVMQEKFICGEFCKGVLFGIEEIGKILAQYFPLKPDDKNEISNRVIIRN
ncbi:MAG: TPM domain-containing protein [Ignavibacteriaceae bacterium]|nr:TPM domain-containing protein [Ignavibacteriaceae bacterium]